MQPKYGYKRNIKQLHELASMFWPSDLMQQESVLSIIPILLETQDQFINILSVDTKSHEELFKVIEASSLSSNLFVKHLCILSDVGGENIQRFNREFPLLFPDKIIKYLRNGDIFEYKFKSMPISGTLNNERLNISGSRLFQKTLLNDLFKDIIVVLTFGSSCTDEATANNLVKCEIANYIGDHNKLSKFVKERYIWVSRITGGAKSNTLGQLAQTFVKDYLKKKLPGVNFSQSRIPGIIHNESGRPTSFDIIAKKGEQHVAIEVSFQVTTNSVIERKAGQAKARFDQIENLGYKIAYVLDGAGNFQRDSALSTICSYSHCNVAFNPNELNVLVDFINGYFEGRI